MKTLLKLLLLFQIVDHTQAAEIPNVYIATAGSKPGIMELAAGRYLVRFVPLERPPLDLQMGENNVPYFVDGLSLKRLEANGEVKTVVRAGAGMEWVALVPGAAGKWLLTDGLDHVVWSIDEKTGAISQLMKYPGVRPSFGMPIGLARLRNGKYALIRPGDNNAPQFVVFENGSISSRPSLHGEVASSSNKKLTDSHFQTTNALSGGKLEILRDGTLVFIDDIRKPNLSLYVSVPIPPSSQRLDDRAR